MGAPEEQIIDNISSSAANASNEVFLQMIEKLTQKWNYIQVLKKYLTSTQEVERSINNIAGPVVVVLIGDVTILIRNLGIKIIQILKTGWKAVINTTYQCVNEDQEKQDQQ